MSDQCCSRKNGARRELSDGDGIEELLLSEPVIILHQSTLQKGDEHVSAAIEDRAETRSLCG